MAGNLVLDPADADSLDAALLAMLDVAEAGRDEDGALSADAQARINRIAEMFGGGQGGKGESGESDESDEDGTRDTADGHDAKCPTCRHAAESPRTTKSLRALVQKKAEHAPPGGVSLVNLKGEVHFYRGGQWIPAKEIANLPASEKARLEQAHAQGLEQNRQRRVARGDVDAAKLKQQLRPHNRQLTADEQKRARAELRALHGFHGELTLHRIEELAKQQIALLRRGKDRKGADLTDKQWTQISGNLARLSAMIGAAQKLGVSGKVPGKKAEDKPVPSVPPARPKPEGYLAYFKPDYLALPPDQAARKVRDAAIAAGESPGTVQRAGAEAFEYASEHTTNRYSRHQRELLHAARQEEAKPVTAAPKFTGIDSHGHKWVDGKQVKREEVSPGTARSSSPMTPEQAATALAEQAGHVTQPKESGDAASRLNRQLIAEGESKGEEKEKEKPKEEEQPAPKVAEKPAEPSPAPDESAFLAAWSKALQDDPVALKLMANSDRDAARERVLRTLTRQGVAIPDRIKETYADAYKKVVGVKDEPAPAAKDESPASTESTASTPEPVDERLHQQDEAARYRLRRGSDKDRTRYWSDEAFRAGIKPKLLHAAAEQVLKDASEARAQRQKLLKDARELLAHYGYNAQALTTNLRSAHVEDDVPALDLVSRTIFERYPEQFSGYDIATQISPRTGRVELSNHAGGADTAEQALLDMFTEGVPPAMPKDKAYEEAFEYLREQKERDDESRRQQEQGTGERERQPGEDDEEDEESLQPAGRAWDDEEEDDPFADPFSSQWKSLRAWLRKSRRVRKDWDSARHPRGQPDNKGEFAPKGGGATEGATAQSEDDYHASGVRSRAFKAWFGDYEDPEAVKKGLVSRVVGWIKGKLAPMATVPHEGHSRVIDHEGKPRAVFHGTQADFDIFDPAKTNPKALLGAGFYFTEDPHVAEEYARGGNVLRGSNEGQGGKPKLFHVFLNIRNPFDADWHLTNLVKNPGVAKFSYEFISSALGGNEKATAALRKLGFDGITSVGKTSDGKGTHRVWVAFEPTQIKAVGNRGTFDPHDASIHKGAGAEVEKARRRHVDASGQQHLWTAEDEAKHPRAPKGGPHGGEFTSGGENGGGSAHPQERLDTALARHAAHPSVTQPGGGSLFGAGDMEGRRGFARLPRGAPVVFTEGEFAGKTGKIVRDTDAATGAPRIVAQVDGRPGLVPVSPEAIEPLHEHHSWRVEGGGSGAGTEQGGLYTADQFLPKREHDAERDWKENGTRSKAFKSWFGDWENDPESASKVVNPTTGQPQETYDLTPRVVYHGTPQGGFRAFDPDRIKDPEAQLYGPGFYFTEDPEVAASYMEKDRPYRLKVPLKEALTWLDHSLAGRDVDEVTRAGWKEDIAHLLRSDDPGAAQRHYRKVDLDLSPILEPAGTPERFAVFLNVRRPFDLDHDRLSFDQLPPETQERLRHDALHADDDEIEEREERLGRIAAKLADPDLADRPRWQARHERGQEQLRKLHAVARARADQLPQQRYDYERLRAVAGNKAGANQLLRQAGHDGLTHQGGYVVGGGQKPHRVWIAFEPTQIKSVDNQGTFDPRESNINKSVQPVVEKEWHP